MEKALNLITKKLGVLIALIIKNLLRVLLQMVKLEDLVKKMQI